MSISLRDVVFISGVSFAHVYQLGDIAMKTGAIRRKCKVSYPAISGHEDFERAYRAHQNMLEYFPIFSTSLWLSGIYFHQVPAGIVGIVYIAARQIYFEGYCKSIDGRIPGFKLQAKCIKYLRYMFAIGFVNFLLEEFVGFSLKEHVLKSFKLEKYLKL